MLEADAQQIREGDAMLIHLSDPLTLFAGPLGFKRGLDSSSRSSYNSIERSYLWRSLAVHRGGALL